MFRRLFFNLWYFRKPPWDSGISPPELFQFIQDHPPGNAIDLGCGTGTNLITLARAGWRVTGVDFAPRAIRTARKKLEKERIEAELRVADVTRLHGIHGPFDLALDLGCFHGIPEEGRGRYLDQLERILAPDGFWLLYAFLGPGTPRSGHGLTEADIDQITSRFLLRARQDGVDKRERPSAWFLFQKS